MEKIFNQTFFQFLLGFAVILGASFGITFAIDLYAESQLAQPPGLDKAIIMDALDRAEEK